MTRRHKKRTDLVTTIISDDILTSSTVVNYPTSTPMQRRASFIWNILLLTKTVDSRRWWRSPPLRTLRRSRAHKIITRQVMAPSIETSRRFFFSSASAFPWNRIKRNYRSHFRSPIGAILVIKARLATRTNIYANEGTVRLYTTSESHSHSD